MDSKAQDVLEMGLEELGLGLNAARVERLIGYHDHLMSWNSKINLTGHKDETQSVVNNLLNALAPAAVVEAGAKTMDVGSGGGLPGIPLAIALDMPQMSLVESKEKKCRFLQDACMSFAPNVRVLQSDVNEIAEPFQQIVSIAFAPLEKLLRVTRAARPKGCKVLAWKGTRDTIDKELAECSNADRQRFEILPFTVPGMDTNVQRHLCIYS